MYRLFKQIKEMSVLMANVTSEQKTKSLEYIIEELNLRREELVEVNNIDITIATESGASEELIKNIVFDDYKINICIDKIKALIELDDPIDKTTLSKRLDDGLDLYRVTYPIGIVATIFEFSPEIFLNMATICIKTGNICILKGNRESRNTIALFYEIIKESTIRVGIDFEWIFNIKGDVNSILQADKYIDLLIPKGSPEFIKSILSNTKIPYIALDGSVCHIYIDSSFNERMALDIIIDSKTQYVLSNNSVQTLLIHEDVPVEFIEKLYIQLERKRVVVNGCDRICKIIECHTLTEEKLMTSFLNYEINIKIVKNLDDAISHINEYGSKHTDVIVTKNGNNALKFMDYVDSANVFYNCSTMFSDSETYGFGTDIGFSTSKTHVRGPVALDGLVTYKYKLVGHGQIIEPYVKGDKRFRYKKLNRDFE